MFSWHPTIPVLVKSSCRHLLSFLHRQWANAFNLKVCVERSDRPEHTCGTDKDFSMKRGGVECMNHRYAVNVLYLLFLLSSLSYTWLDISAPARPPSAPSYPIHHLLVVLTERGMQWGLYVHLQAMPGTHSPDLISLQQTVLHTPAEVPFPVVCVLCVLASRCNICKR